MRHNSRKRLVEFVRNGCRHLRHAQRTLQARKIVLRLDKILLCLVLLLNVDVYTVPACDSAVFRTLRNAAHQKPAISTVRGPHPRLDLEPFATFQRRLPTLAKERLVFRMDHIEEYFSFQILCVLAQVVTQGVVAVFNGTRKRQCAISAAEWLRSVCAVGVRSP